jgi:hypothetical protein
VVDDLIAQAPSADVLRGRYAATLREMREHAERTQALIFAVESAQDLRALRHATDELGRHLDTSTPQLSRKVVARAVVPDSFAESYERPLLVELAKSIGLDFSPNLSTVKLREEVTHWLREAVDKRL